MSCCCNLFPALLALHACTCVCCLLRRLSRHALFHTFFVMTLGAIFTFLVLLLAAFRILRTLALSSNILPFSSLAILIAWLVLCLPLWWVFFSLLMSSTLYIVGETRVECYYSPIKPSLPVSQPVFFSRWDSWPLSSPCFSSAACIASGVLSSRSGYWSFSFLLLC